MPAYGVRCTSACGNGATQSDRITAKLSRQLLGGRQDIPTEINERIERWRLLVRCDLQTFPPQHVRMCDDIPSDFVLQYKKVSHLEARGIHIGRYTSKKAFIRGGRWFPTYRRLCVVRRRRSNEINRLREYATPALRGVTTVDS
jgi:hypothetical protein